MRHKCKKGCNYNKKITYKHIKSVDKNTNLVFIVYYKKNQTSKLIMKNISHLKPLHKTLLMN